jgi:hypothetical protein
VLMIGGFGGGGWRTLVAADGPRKLQPATV